MKNRAYYLSSCKTCIRILDELGWDNFEAIDIKNNPVPAEHVDEFAKAAGSYEAIFNKRAMKYRSQGLKEMSLSEDQWREYITNEYTFIKRPILTIDGQHFIGNAKKTIDAAKEALGK